MAAKLNRWALGVQYMGGQYAGWQSQPDQIAVQDVLEQGLSKVADQPIRVTCAGRTDAGVHALGQVVHFDTPIERSGYNWLAGTNQHLPDDVKVLWAKPVSEEFHARYAATSRRYAYRILQYHVPVPMLAGRVYWYPWQLNEVDMHAAAQHWVGKHDFSSFRGADCQAKSAVRELREMRVYRQGARVLIEVEANAFLHHMVRNMVGALMRVGCGKASVGWAAEVLALQSRRLAVYTMAPAAGLYLMQVDYPQAFQLPIKDAQLLAWD